MIRMSRDRERDLIPKKAKDLTPKKADIQREHTLIQVDHIQDKVKIIHLQGKVVEGNP